jgi:AcrR family transcriptional regulator
MPPLGGTLTIRTRRRGLELESAILAAAAQELIDVGYDGLTMEGVAGRAHTGKASVYRRWPSKQLLVLDALSANLPCPQSADPQQWGTATTRDMLVAMGNEMADAMRGPFGRLAASLAGQAVRDAELARLMDEGLMDPRCSVLVTLLERGVSRGEVRPEAANRLVAGVGPSLLLHEVFSRGRVPGRDWVDEVVDQILMPIITPCPPAG